MIREKLEVQNTVYTKGIMDAYKSGFIHAFMGISPFFLKAMEPILDNVPISTYCIDMQKKRFTYVSESFCRLLGAHDLTEINQRAAENSLFQNLEDGKAWSRRVESTTNGGPYLIALQREVGGHFEPTYVFESSVSIYDAKGRLSYSVGFLQDANDVHKMQEDLREQMYIDPLTLLHNRKFVEDKLGNEVKTWPNTSILMLDIDRFKIWNDEKGHQSGDDILRQIGLYVRSFLDKHDLACRYGGEEIIIAVPVGLGVATAIANRLCNGIAKIGKIPGKSTLQDGTTLTVSIGVASGNDLLDLIRKADTALYKAKESGRNQIVVYQDGMTMPENGKK